MENLYYKKQTEKKTKRKKQKKRQKTERRKITYCRIRHARSIIVRRLYKIAIFLLENKSDFVPRALAVSSHYTLVPPTPFCPPLKLSQYTFASHSHRKSVLDVKSSQQNP